MISTRLLSALAAATTVFSMALADTTTPTPTLLITTPTVIKPASAMIEMGCYETSVPLEDHGPYGFQTPGNCQLVCLSLDKPVMALAEGTNCWCGDKLPPKSAVTDNSTCDTNCKGDDRYKCGGPSMYWVVLTGQTGNRIPVYDPNSSSSTSSSTSKTAAPVSESTQAQTILVTASSTPKSNESKGPNKAGIAAGVVVGVVVLAAVVAGVILFLRHKRRRDLEEEHRRRDAVNSFVGGKLHTSNSSMTDSRLDPEFMNRRASNGSIADNEDYSRRILKVTNA